MSPPLLPTGIMSFAAQRRLGYYYADKTAFLRELIAAADPLLLTRPRRFGKTLTQYTLKSFLELDYEHPGSPNADAELFEGLAVSEDADLCAQYQSQFPVIFLTLKDVQFDTFAGACDELCGRIAALGREFAFLTDEQRLTPFQREDLTDLMRLTRLEQDGRRTELLTSSLILLAQCLYTVYKRPAYILIDEHDVPLLKAAASCTPEDHSYYSRLRDLMCSLLGKVVKTGDPSVRRCLLTSCLRLTLPGRFSGLNNLLVLGMEDQRCAGLMGFTQTEVDRLLRDCGLEEHREEIRGWYDGYLCGATRLYNPWSLLQHCACLQANPGAEPQNYWAETTSDDFRPFFLNELSAAGIARLQCLVDGGSIPLKMRRAIGYPDLEAEGRDDQAFFTLLYYTGYLTRRTAGGEDFVIPNCEVLDSFTTRIGDYFTAEAAINPRCRALIEALLSGNPAAVQSRLRWLYAHYLDMQAAAARLRGGGRLAAAPEEQETTPQPRHNREQGYQVLIQGILTAFDGGIIEDLIMEHTLGSGRADISFEGRGSGFGTACLLEFKVARGESEASMERAAKLGLTQSRDNGCAQALLEGNPSLEIVYSYGIGCRAKSCRVQVEAVKRG